MKGIEMRDDYSAGELRALARRSHNAKQTRRLMALAAVADGLSRVDAAAIGLMDSQTLRDWVHRFNAQGPQGLIDRKSTGPKSKLTADQRATLKEIVIAGPDPAIDGVVRWRCADLAAVIKTRFAVEYHESSVGKLLRSLNLSHVSARPQHPKQNPETIEAFKKNFQLMLKQSLKHLCSGTPIELWFQDEARVGQKNGQVYQWAEKGTRPRQAADQRNENAYIFGAVCPALDKGAALVMPYANTHAMQQHLDQISASVATNAHGAILMDGAGWHRSDGLNIPDNLSILLLPPYSPELNPTENIWQFLRQNFLSNMVFDTWEAIVEACCYAWNRLTAETGRINSIATRSWATTGQ